MAKQYLCFCRVLFVQAWALREGRLNELMTLVPVEKPNETTDGQ